MANEVPEELIHINSWDSDNEHDETMYDDLHDVDADNNEDVDHEEIDEIEHNDGVHGFDEYNSQEEQDDKVDSGMGTEPFKVASDTDASDTDEKPYLGMKFVSGENAYDFYNAYAKRVGFGVRRGGVRRSKKDRSIIGYRFFCNKEGYREERHKKNEDTKKRHRGETRVGCKARIYVNKQEDGMWAVTVFEDEHHQHKCVTPRKTHLFSSHRKVDENRGAMAEKMKDAGIRTNLMMHYLAEEAQGRPNVGFTERDLRNHLRKKRRDIFQRGDAQCLLDYLNEKQSENPHFYYSIQLDDEAQMTNFFWVDAKARMDYRYFGDVVCIDATYGTNAYAKPFVPIVGVNNHLQTVLFGCALMLDETETSFKWVLQKWMTAMNSSYPKVIFTDQDSAMTSAIASILPNTRHRFCLWHIFQNVKKHLGHLFRRGSSFGTDFSICVRSFKTVEDFELGWQSLLSKYNVSENEWLAKLYSKREKWVPVYSRKFFCADMSTTQRSESINKFFKGFLNRNMLLLDFVRCIDKALVSRRQAENDADFYMNNVLPRLQLYMPIEEVASKIYTPAIFKKFQEELMGGLRYICEKIETDGTISSYRCKVVGNESIYRVIRFNSVDHTVSCTCGKYESMGILCKHILRVFIVENVYQIPEQYILKRWLGDAKSEIVTDEHGAQLHENCETPLTLRYSILCHEAIAIATSGIVSQDVFEVARAGFRRTRYDVEEAKKNFIIERKNDGHISKSAVEDNIIIRDPEVVKNKGRPGRCKAFWEKKSGVKQQQKKKVQTSTRSQKKKGTIHKAQTDSQLNQEPILTQQFSVNMGTEGDHNKCPDSFRSRSQQTIEDYNSLSGIQNVGEMDKETSSNK